MISNLFWRNLIVESSNFLKNRVCSTTATTFYNVYLVFVFPLHIRFHREESDRMSPEFLSESCLPKSSYNICNSILVRLSRIGSECKSGSIWAASADRQRYKYKMSNSNTAYRIINHFRVDFASYNVDFPIIRVAFEFNRKRLIDTWRGLYVILVGGFRIKSSNFTHKKGQILVQKMIRVLIFQRFSQNSIIFELKKMYPLF